MLRARDVMMAAGERLSLPVDVETGLPDGDLARFVLATYRQKGRAATTIEQRVDDLVAALNHFGRLGLDLLERAARGAFLTNEEIAAFSLFCRVHRKNPAETVGAGVASIRFAVLLSYVDWIARPVIARETKIDRHALLLGQLADFAKRAEALAPSMPIASSRDEMGERLGLTDEQREIFLRVIVPGAEGNPFDPDLQLRNYAYLMLHYNLGCRSGELLQLKLRDFKFAENPAKVVIHRRPGDPEDPRPRQPTAKTRARILPIEDDLADLVMAFIKQRRSRAADGTPHFPKAKSHPFLCINKDGAPLSSRGYQKMVAQLRQVPGLEGLVSHEMRHDWNDRYVESASAEGVDHERVRKEQIEAMGWSDHSKMPARYSRRATQKSTNERSLKLQAKAMRGDGA